MLMRPNHGKRKNEDNGVDTEQLRSLGIDSWMYKLLIARTASRILAYRYIEPSTAAQYQCDEIGLILETIGHSLK